MDKLKWLGHEDQVGRRREEAGEEENMGKDN